jgi:hypothetical protein
MGYEQQVIDNAAAIQALIDAAKQIPQLTEIVGNIDETDLVAVYSQAEGKTVFVAQGELVGINMVPIIEISGQKFELWKNPLNNDTAKKKIMEINDIIKGFYSATEYFEAQYLGGNSASFTDFAVYNVFAGTALQ